MVTELYMSWDFPGGPVVKILSFQCKGPCHVVWTKKKKRKAEPYSCSNHGDLKDARTHTHTHKRCTTSDYCHFTSHLPICHCRREVSQNNKGYLPFNWIVMSEGCYHSGEKIGPDPALQLERTFQSDQCLFLCPSKQRTLDADGFHLAGTDTHHDWLHCQRTTGTH